MAIREWLERFADESVKIKDRTPRDLGATRVLLRNPMRPVHFQDLEGSEAVGNLWSTRERVAAAFGVSQKELFTQIMAAQAHPKDTRLVDRTDFLKNSTNEVNLFDLPVPKIFPRDAGRYITAGVWVAESKGKRNLSFHRIQILDKNHGACRIVPRHLWHMYNEAVQAGESVTRSTAREEKF